MTKTTRYPYKKATDWTESQKAQIEKVASAVGDSANGIIRRAWNEFYERWTEKRNTPPTKVKLGNPTEG